MREIIISGEFDVKGLNLGKVERPIKYLRFKVEFPPFIKVLEVKGKEIFSSEKEVDRSVSLGEDIPIVKADNLPSEKHEDEKPSDNQNTTKAEEC